MVEVISFLGATYSISNNQSIVLYQPGLMLSLHIQYEWPVLTNAIQIPSIAVGELSCLNIISGNSFSMFFALRAILNITFLHIYSNPIAFVDFLLFVSFRKHGKSN